MATYNYNARNQRNRKETPTQTIIYHYDLAGNLISETDQTGAVVKNYVWDGSQPVAQISVAGGETVAYLHTDHLQTPRQASDQNGLVVWRWDDVDGFGAVQADQDPDNDGNLVVVSLRFPGQYENEESGLYYNWNRYYDPKTGRYLTSDPIGLNGGLNTYLYVNANPLRLVDPFGLESPVDWWLPTPPPRHRLITPWDPGIPPSQCDHYPREGWPAMLRIICSGTRDEPNMNCARRCLRATYFPEGSLLDQIGWYFPIHPICWFECGLGGALPPRIDRPSSACN